MTDQPLNTFPYSSRDQDVTDWLTVEQYATAAGISARTVRRRIHSGRLSARQVVTRNGVEWRVEPPPQYQAVLPAPEELGLVPVATVERLMGPLLQDRADLRARLDAAESARRADAEEIGRLRGLLEAATRRIAELQAERDPDRPRPHP